MSGAAMHGVFNQSRHRVGLNRFDGHCPQQDALHGHTPAYSVPIQLKEVS